MSYAGRALFGAWIGVFTRQGDGTMKLSRSIGVDSGPATPAA